MKKALLAVVLALAAALGLAAGVVAAYVLALREEEPRLYADYPSVWSTYPTGVWDSNVTWTEWTVSGDAA